MNRVGSQQNQAKQANRINCAIYTSSHFNPFSGRAAFNRKREGGRWLTPKQIKENEDKADQLFNNFFRGFPYLRTWGGITFLEEFEENSFKTVNKSDIRKDQVKKFIRDFTSSNHSASLFVFGSNDYKALVSKEEKLIHLSPRCARRWRSLNKYLDQKINFNPDKTHGLLGNADKLFIGKNVNRLLDWFVEVIKRSGMETIFWSSILERVYVDQPNLDILFAYMNHFLREGLERFNLQGIFNRDGKKVLFVFINVANQFYNASDKISLAREDEGKRGELIHRNEKAMVDLAGIYVAKILETLSSK